MTPRWRSPAAAALVNTSPEADRPDGTGVERLPDVAALAELFDTWEWTGAREPAARPSWPPYARLRPRLARLWTADEDEAVEIVNGLLRDASALPQLVKHGRLGLPPARDRRSTRRWPTGWRSRPRWR